MDSSWRMVERESLCLAQLSAAEARTSSGFGGAPALGSEDGSMRSCAMVMIDWRTCLAEREEVKGRRESHEPLLRERGPGRLEVALSFGGEVET
jgi:hypothetical protein